MKTLKEVVEEYGQEEVARQSGRGQSGISLACTQNRAVYAHEADGYIALFEVKRIDKTGLDVEFPKLVMPKKVAK